MSPGFDSMTYATINYIWIGTLIWVIFMLFLN